MYVYLYVCMNVCVFVTYTRIPRAYYLLGKRPKTTSHGGLSMTSGPDMPILLFFIRPTDTGILSASMCSYDLYTHTYDTYARGMMIWRFRMWHTHTGILCVLYASKCWCNLYTYTCVYTYVSHIKTDLVVLRHTDLVVLHTHTHTGILFASSVYTTYTQACVNT